RHHGRGRRSDGTRGVGGPGRARRGRRVIRLRPVEVGDIDELERQRCDADAAGDFAWFGFAQPGWLRQRFDERRLLTEENGTLAIVTASGALVGEVSWVRRDNSSPPNG